MFRLPWHFLGGRDFYCRNRLPGGGWEFVALDGGGCWQLPRLLLRFLRLISWVEAEFGGCIRDLDGFGVGEPSCAGSGTTPPPDIWVGVAAFWVFRVLGLNTSDPMFNVRLNDYAP